MQNKLGYKNVQHSIALPLKIYKEISGELQVWLLTSLSLSLTFHLPLNGCAT